MNAKAIGAFVALAIVAAAGLWISGLYVERNLARAAVETQKGNVAKANARAEDQQARADRFEAALGQCTSAAAEQSKAVLALKADRDRLQKLHDGNVAKAKREAKPNYDRAVEIAAMKRPADADACAWARELVDEELRRERSK